MFPPFELAQPTARVKGYYVTFKGIKGNTDSTGSVRTCALGGPTWEDTSSELLNHHRGSSFLSEGCENGMSYKDEVQKNTRDQKINSVTSILY